MNLAMQTLYRASSGSLTRGGVQALLANGGQLVDVRSPAEFQQDALPGALNLPVDALYYDYNQLDKRAAVILYGCSADVACSRAARLLAGKGFLRIYQLAGSEAVKQGRL
jgi:rhodanese-related sulfurtransferase